MFFHLSSAFFDIFRFMTPSRLNMLPHIFNHYLCLLLTTPSQLNEYIESSINILSHNNHNSCCRLVVVFLHTTNWRDRGDSAIQLLSMKKKKEDDVLRLFQLHLSIADSALVCFSFIRNISTCITECFTTKERSVKLLGTSSKCVTTEIVQERPFFLHKSRFLQRANRLE